MLAAIVVASLLGVPGVVTVQAARAPGPLSRPHLEIAPTCVNLPQQSDASSFSADLLVSGRDFTPGQTLRIDLDPSFTRIVPPPLATVVVSPYGSFDQPVTVQLANQFAQHLLVATDVNNGDFTIRLPFNVPCQPHISITPTCGPAVDPPTSDSYAITVTGTGWGQGIDVSLVFGINANPIGTPIPVSPNVDGGFTADLRQQVLPAGVYQVIASQPAIEGPGTTVTAEFRTPCPTPTLVVDPTCGPAGSPPDTYQLTLSGAGFIPGRTVVFAFDPGPNTQFFVLDKGVPDTGVLDPLAIDPFLRPAGTYDVVAREFAGDQVVLEVHATFDVPCLTPTISLDPPDCGSPQFIGDQPQRYAITIRGNDFIPGDVSIVFDPTSTDPALPPETFTTPVEKSGTFVRAIDPLRRPSGTYRIVVSEQIRAKPVQLELAFRVPCKPPKPTLRRDPVCGPESPGAAGAYSIQLTLGGYIPGFVELIFDATGTPETFSGTVLDNGTLVTTIDPTGRAAGTYRITARQRDREQGTALAERSVTFTVPCAPTTTPSIRLDPPNSAPGFVIFVVGSDFPQNAAVTLRWDHGIGASRPITVQPDATGAFRAQVLIFPHDFAGLRTLQAGTDADPAAFPTATATFLVVAGQGSPPSFGAFDPFGTTGVTPIISRR
jgi:hypothetical protein